MFRRINNCQITCLLAHEQAKDQKLNYGDEITYALRLAKKKRFNQLEEKRIKQEVELQSYLVDLIEQDKQRKFKRIEEEAIAKSLSDNDLTALQSESDKKCDNYLSELSDMFSQLDIRRKVRFGPDFRVLSKSISKTLTLSLRTARNETYRTIFVEK